MKVASYAALEKCLYVGEVQDAIDLMLEMTLADYPFRDARQIECTLLDVIENHHDVQLRTLAVTCLGHIGRIEGRIQSRCVVPKLLNLEAESEFSGAARDALSDIWLNAAYPLPISLREQILLFSRCGIGLRFLPWRLHWRKRRSRLGRAPRDEWP